MIRSILLALFFSLVCGLIGALATAPWALTTLCLLAGVAWALLVQKSQMTDAQFYVGLALFMFTSMPATVLLREVFQ